MKDQHNNNKEVSLSVSLWTEPHNGERIPVIVRDDAAVPDDDDDESSGWWWRRVRLAVHEGHAVAMMTTTLVASLVTFSLIQGGEAVHAQLTTMIVIALAGHVVPRLVTGAVCGALVGANAAITSYTWLLPTASLTAVCWVLVNRYRVLHGYSGRLGTTALVAFVVSAISFLAPSGHMPWRQFGITTALWSHRLSWRDAGIVVLSCVVTTVTAAAVRLHVGRPSDPVVTPVAVALVIMLLANGVVDYTIRYTAFDGVVIGVQVAMASTRRLPTVRAFAVVGFLAGLWGLVWTPFLLGFPKAGFAATLGYVSYEGLKLARQYWPHIRKHGVASILEAYQGNGMAKETHHQDDVTVVKETEYPIAAADVEWRPTEEEEDNKPLYKDDNHAPYRDHDYDYNAEDDIHQDYQHNNNNSTLYEEEFRLQIEFKENDDGTLGERMFL